MSKVNWFLYKFAKRESRMHLRDTYYAPHTWWHANKLKMLSKLGYINTRTHLLCQKDSMKGNNYRIRGSTSWRNWRVPHASHMARNKCKLVVELDVLLGEGCALLMHVWSSIFSNAEALRWLGSRFPSFLEETIDISVHVHSKVAHPPRARFTWLNELTTHTRLLLYSVVCFKYRNFN